jgi:hypothetical protein
MKICSKCKVNKTFSNFSKDITKPDGRYPSCRSCRKKSEENYYLKVKYNLSIEAYEGMVRSQNGVCAICKKFSLNGCRLVVDHDHISGRIRGLLCDNCNLALGLFKDSLETLSSAFDYLENKIKTY